MIYTSDLTSIVNFFPNGENYKIEYDTISGIPKDYISIINRQLESRTEGHYKNFKFHSAIEIDIDRYLKDYPNAIFTLWDQLCKFAIVYEWKDLSIGIGLHYIFLNIDSYGQITRFNFPDLSLEKDTEFTSLDDAKSVADSLMDIHSRSYNLDSYSLSYESEYKVMCWAFFYNATDENNEEITYSCTVSLIDKMSSGLWVRKHLSPIYEIVDDLEEPTEEIIEFNDK
jgi:hypothetical protein